MPLTVPNSLLNINNRHRSSIYKIFFYILTILPNLTNSLPISLVSRTLGNVDAHIEKAREPLSTFDFYMYLAVAALLVLLGGIFAGLTLGLMGQDEVYLKVMADSGTPTEKRCAKEVLRLIGRGKHWVLVTLLLSNVITNETLPVILDRFLGGGFAAVFSSTVSIVIFGEVIPQSVCVRYGLQLGAYFSPFVLFLMYVMYPVAYPTAMLLDYILGQDHGTVYKKSGLKTLVTLHKTMGVERLNQDEVTIISAVLDLKEKSVSEIMTPINKVYTMSSDRILDEKTVEEIFNSGFSRIPIHLPGEPKNFVGMLLVRILISYDPDDELPVSSFPLATLPETGLDTSCLNILNYFQEGKSHMVVVSETPGMDTGAKGVLTLEDVIEELIGEEIIDESDVYIDLDKNIKRQIPGPLARRNVSTYLHGLYSNNNSSNQIMTSAAYSDNQQQLQGEQQQQQQQLPLEEGSRRSIDSIRNGTGNVASYYYYKRDSIDSNRSNSNTNTNSNLENNSKRQNLIDSKDASNANADSTTPAANTTTTTTTVAPAANTTPSDADNKKLDDTIENNEHAFPHQINSTTANGMKPSNLAVNPLQTNNTHVTIKKQPNLVAPVPKTPLPNTQSSNNALSNNSNNNNFKSPILESFKANDRTSLSRSPSPNIEYGAIHTNEASAFIQGVHDNLQRNIKNGNGNGNSNGNGLDKARQIASSQLPGIPLPTRKTSPAVVLEDQQFPVLVSQTSSSSSDFKSNNSNGNNSNNVNGNRKEYHMNGKDIGNNGSSHGYRFSNSENQSIKSGTIIENIVSFKGVNKTVIDCPICDIDEELDGMVTIPEDKKSNISNKSGDQNDGGYSRLDNGSNSNSNSNSNRKHRDSKSLFW
ncbi:hypothetical protein BVG19_g1905 [[Candida] boidinii]|nr:hypothetical protein BVG19_g1905 [[Candida] boidinii]OWB53413.1 hypothetical protein B5S27_g5009 [[Candida] boidinii]